MKRERNNINFNDLFSKYEQLKALKENNENDIKNGSKTLGNEVNAKSRLSNVWGFLNTPISRLVNKKENKGISLKLLKEYQYFYELFEVFKPETITLDAKSIFKRFLIHYSPIVLLCLCVALYVSHLMIYVFTFAFLAGLFNFLLKEDNFNGKNEEMLYRKYKTFFAMLLTVRKNINSKEDLRKFFTVMGNNTSMNIGDDKLDKYTEKLWPFLGGLTEEKIGVLWKYIEDNESLKKISKDDLIEVMHKSFKELLENRNSSNEEVKEWDSLIDIFTNQDIANDLKLLENIDIMNT